jgi:stage II sporulation protein D
MRLHRYFRNIVVLALIVLVSGCTWFNKPQPKPEPAPPPPTESKEPPPPSVDFSKYKTEPSISVYMAETGEKRSMPLEQYLEGVVAAEMEPDWPLEALKAQAVVARTITLNAIEQKTVQRIRQTDVSTNKAELQSYNIKKVNEQVKAAVKSTRGMAMTYKGAFVNAIYSSCCGQKTATKEESYEKEIPYDAEYFHSVDCPCYDYAPDRVKYWSLKLSGDEWKNVVGYQGPAQNVQILERGPSGRALYIGADEKKQLASEVRKRLGYDKMLSTLITNVVYQQDGKVYLEGKGWGNGVGLCQWGAYTWGQRQQTYDYILHYYYRDVAIQKLWE